MPLYSTLIPTLVSILRKDLLSLELLELYTLYSTETTFLKATLYS
jgi:hypothetical protein